MLSLDSLKIHSVQWQTSLLNVAREYVQNVFLSYLYQSPESDHLAFKGGTALRILYGSPRFSEDLDFTGALKPFRLGKLLSRTVSKVTQEAIPMEVLEAKPSSGGYLALYTCRVYQEIVRLELNVSLRGKAAAAATLVTSPLIPSYQCLQLPEKALVAEKMQALLTRKKPRDYFDLYFLLRQRVGVAAIIPLKQQLLKEVRRLEARTIQRELKLFLPVSHHKTIANLPSVLTQELNRL